MERDQEKTEDLFDRENRLTASLLRTFQSLLHHGASRVDNTASVGQAAYNAMATDILMNGMIKSVEELLSLTRTMRELWVVGGLKKPGEGDEEVEREIQKMWEGVRGVEGGWRVQKRREELGEGMGLGQGVGEYREGEVGPPLGHQQQQFGQGQGQGQGQQGGVGVSQSGNATPNLSARMGTATGAGGGPGGGGNPGGGTMA
ncbi:hypothetical protein SMACR_09381 [Sordaria macrospora]|uniref:Uncharacterized protein n=1 Tax=Sordaria macrospora TaxID=5147 RepID=A0A8S8ZHG9_SORMA|nr:hypothetical protein SMACR_09381 [Sordaria macrospora]KAH7631972.1 hypothetical protein B0T09DRAFT_372950 [Sordaria sp. MPI-SDFR-AT-0083]WPJ63274.1 hypothetical protein SMAC4_09381 [Sordaria macrospora]